MLKIISFSVWGNSLKYLNGCIENIEIAEKIYPGWVVRFYCDSEVNRDFIRKLEKAGAEVVIKNTIKDNWEGLFWRFLPASEADVFISRDIDSRLNEREKAAVDEWLLSDKKIHCMRDHIEHNVPMLGGMWGCRDKIIPNMEQLISQWSANDYKGSDQDFLRTEIWPHYLSTILVHDRYFDGLIVEKGQHRRGLIGVDRLDSEFDYVYDPIRFFGKHDIRPFPNHSPMTYGVHVGEII